MYPTLFKIGPIGVDAYYPLIAAAFAVFLWLARRRAAQVGLPAGWVTAACVWTFLGGMAGAYLGYFAFFWDYYRQFPEEILKLHKAGMASSTGYPLALLTLFLYTCRSWRPFWPAADLLMPAGALGEAIARVGCFLTGCCVGTPSALPWAVIFPGEAVRRHPTQLYESAAMLILFLYLKGIERRSPPAGTVSFTAFILYGALRILLDPARVDSRPGPLGVAWDQWVGLAVMAWGIAGLWRVRCTRSSSGSAR